ncbi:MAG: hypothetical protein AABY04_00135 [Candidatus Micrarchaeota archaeon]
MEFKNFDSQEGSKIKSVWLRSLSGETKIQNPLILKSFLEYGKQTGIMRDLFVEMGKNGKAIIRVYEDGASKRITPTKAKFLLKILVNYDPKIKTFEQSLKKLFGGKARLDNYKHVFLSGAAIRKVVLDGQGSYQAEIHDPREFHALLSERESEKKQYGKYFKVAEFDRKKGILHLRQFENGEPGEIGMPIDFAAFNHAGATIAKIHSLILERKRKAKK